MLDAARAAHPRAARAVSVDENEVKTEIFDGATSYSTYVRGVIVDGDRGELLIGSVGSAVVIEG